MFLITNKVANPVLIPLLRSRPGARLGRRLAVVEYVGRRTGRRHRLVTQYSMDGLTVRIPVGAADRKAWWRNFRQPTRLQLRLAGVDHDAVAHVVTVGDEVALEVLLRDPGS
jgi:hypothetical protein